MFIENNLVLAARLVPKCGCVKAAASSNLIDSIVKKHMLNDWLDFYILRCNRSIQDKVENQLRQLSGIDNKGTDPKFKYQRDDSVEVKGQMAAQICLRQKAKTGLLTTN